MEKYVNNPQYLWITLTNTAFHMFIGEYKYSIDDKKRLAAPAKFRGLLGKKAIITQGLDKCLILYPAKEWGSLAKKIAKLPLAQADARNFARLMLGGAMEVSFDGLGRILIPDYLKNYAGLKKKVIFVGLYDRVEIWDEEEFQKNKKQTEITAGNIAERLKDLGV